MRTAAGLRTGDDLAVTAGGIRSPLLASGPVDSEEAVVFVHGNPGSSQDWADFVVRTGRFARAVAFDMPGFGRADKPKDFEYTVEGYATHLGRILDELRIRRAHLVLHDFGGPWGLVWAMKEPARLASVVLIDTGVLRDYRWHYLARIWRTPVLGEILMATANRTAFRALFNYGNPRPLPRPFVDRMFDDYDADTRRAILKLYRSTNSRANVEATRFEALPLRRPALVIWGRHDPYIAATYAARQRETFPDAEIHVLDGCGHWPFVDDPQAVSELLVAFLERNVPTPT